MYNYFISVKDIVYKCYNLTLCIFVLKENFTSNPSVKCLVMHSNMVNPNLCNGILSQGS